MYAFNEKSKIDTFKRFTGYIERMFQKMKIKNDLQCDKFFLIDLNCHIVK